MSHWANTIRNFEVEEGNRLIEEAPWFNREEWREAVLSEDQQGRIRIILLDAHIPGQGAFTRLITGIQGAGLDPVIVEPIGGLTNWCKKHGWRKRIIKKGTDEVQEIWYARKARHV